MDKTTYILGAGFSRYAGLPLMNDFYFKSKDMYPKLTDNYDKVSFLAVFEYFEKFSKVKHIMNADFYNIEELLSIIEMDSFIKKDSQIKSYYLNYLAKVIEFYTPQQTNRNNDFMIDTIITTEIYSKFLSDVYGIKLYDGKSHYFRDPNNDNGIISLNYDLMIENSIYKIHIQNMGFDLSKLSFNYGIENINIVKAGYYKDGLKLAKLHGSINFNNNGHPLIIPPTWNKTSNPEMIQVWQLAHKLIEQANKLVFIGYSLPTTDLYVKYLLISGIKDSDNLKKIIVICPDSDGNTKQRYENFFDENYRNKAFEYIPKKFEDWLSSR